MPGSPRTHTLTIRTRQHEEAIDITERVAAFVGASGIANGLCHVAALHTTAGVFVNENADPDVPRDLLATLERLVPVEGDYRHAEGNAAAHIKASLVGTVQAVPVVKGQLGLGRWQAIFLAEFDGPRERQLQLTIVGT